MPIALRTMPSESIIRITSPANRAERHADADLTRPATGRERENSIEAGRGEEQAGHAEAGGDDGAGPLGQQHDRRRPLQRDDARSRQVGIDGPDGLAEVLGKPLRCAPVVFTTSEGPACQTWAIGK